MSRSLLRTSLAANAVLTVPAAFGVAVLARRQWRNRRAAAQEAQTRAAQLALEQATNIRTCALAAFDPVFALDPVFGPTLATEVRFVGRGGFHVLGGTTDFEAWILAVLAKRARCMFEFGTCTGKTTYLWAVNSEPGARVVTLTLAPEQAAAFVNEGSDNQARQEIATGLQESVCSQFLYSETPVAGKVTQLYGDSKEFDETPYAGQCDLVFVDGSHEYSYVASDTAKALRMVRPGGIVLWHDYYGAHAEMGEYGVYRALNEAAAHRLLVHLEGTAIVAYRCPPDTRGPRLPA